MAIQKYVSDKIIGLSTDSKPTNISDGAVFFETDTKKIYLKISGSWEEVAYNNYTDAEAVSAIKDDPSYFPIVPFENNDLGAGTELIDSIEITTSGTFSWYFTLVNTGKLYAGEIIGSVLPVDDGYGGITYYTNKALGVYTIGSFETPQFNLEYNTGTNELELKVDLYESGWEIKGKRFEVGRI